MKTITVTDKTYDLLSELAGRYGLALTSYMCDLAKEEYAMQQSDDALTGGINNVDLMDTGLSQAVVDK